MWVLTMQKISAAGQPSSQFCVTLPRLIFPARPGGHDLSGSRPEDHRQVNGVPRGLQLAGGSGKLPSVQICVY